MHINFAVTIAGLIAGFVIGLTGVGGGALLTPLLIMLNVNPLTAVSTDIVASLVLKPIGGFVHLRERTVNMKLVLWLSVGSMPAALAGVYTITHIGGDVDTMVKEILGWVLIVAAAAMIAKVIVSARRPTDTAAPGTIPVKILPTIAIGVVGGYIVGMTSVGSGSLMVVCLMLLYMRMSTRELVGTDLVQAIPLIGAATIGILLWGHLQFATTASLLIGAIPAVYIGARMSARANDGYIRPVIVVALIFSALKVLNASDTTLKLVLAVCIVPMTIELVRVARHDIADRRAARAAAAAAAGAAQASPGDVALADA